MKLSVWGLLVVVLFSCRTKEAEPSINIAGRWKWISTAQDSTLNEDTSNTSNTQLLNIIDYKNVDWKRNDTVYYNGIYLHSVKKSVVYGTNKPMMKLYDIPFAFLLNRNKDTLWLQEDKVGGATYRFLKE